MTPTPRKYQNPWGQSAMAICAWPTVGAGVRERGPDSRAPCPENYAAPHVRISLDPTDFSTSRESASAPNSEYRGTVEWGAHAVDHEGEGVEVFATKRRDRRAALKFLKRAMKRYGGPEVIVTGRLRSYGAAMKDIGAEDRQRCGRWLNNRAENSHQPFRRREGAMARFRDVKTLQKFAAAHASIHNHFNRERHLYSRENFKLKRSAALAEWRQLAA